jgi:hypothetical protein
MSKSFPNVLNITAEKSHKSKQLREQLLSSYSSDPEVLAFVTYLCQSNPDDSEPKLEMADFCTRILYECLCEDKLEMVHVYVQLYCQLSGIIKGIFPNAQEILSLLCMIRANRLHSSATKFIVDDGFIDQIDHHLKELFSDKLSIENALSDFVQSGRIDQERRLYFSSYLVYHGWPIFPSDLKQVLDWARANPELIQNSKVASLLARKEFPLVSRQALQKIFESL